ncbi:MAG: glycosyltransferase family 4 protein [Puniceicoccaceae bacterium]
MPDIKVILIGNYVHDRQESMQRFADMLLEGLVNIGLQVQRISPRPIFGDLKPASTGLGKWLGYIDKFLIFPFKLRRLARQEIHKGNTVFHICDHSYSMYEKWLRDVPCIITCHDLLAIRSARGEFRKNPTSWTGKCLQKWICHSLKNAKAITCVSESTAMDLRRLTGHTNDKSKIVYNGLNFPYKVIPTEQARISALNIVKQANITQKRGYMFHVGGSQWYKNRLGLLEIYSELFKMNPNPPALVIAGQPSTKDCLGYIENSPFSERVHFIGRVSNEELNDLYSGAKIFLFPSLSEGFGWPIIEAQAAGCPVVTSDIPPMNEIGGEAVTYIDPEHPTQAAESIYEILNESPEDRAARIQHGIAHANSFSQSNMVDNYIKEYESLLG